MLHLNLKDLTWILRFFLRLTLKPMRCIICQIGLSHSEAFCMGRKRKKKKYLGMLQNLSFIFSPHLFYALHYISSGWSHTSVICMKTIKSYPSIIKKITFSLHIFSFLSIQTEAGHLCFSRHLNLPFLFSFPSLAGESTHRFPQDNSSPSTKPT